MRNKQSYLDLSFYFRIQGILAETEKEELEANIKEDEFFLK